MYIKQQQRKTIRNKREEGEELIKKFHLK